MRKFIIPGLTVLLLNIACENSNGTTSAENQDLEVKKEILLKQIDSLQAELEQINRQLGLKNMVNIPYIQADSVKTSTFTKYLEFQGNVKTDGNVTVVPSFMGEVKKIYVKVGQRVRKGQPLMKLDDAVLRNQISEVQTQYKLAKTAYERQKKLWEQKIGSEMQFLQAKTKKESLARKLNTLYAQLKKTVVKSPISGTVDDLMIKEGEMATPQRPVARIVSLKDVYMEADVSEKYLTKIKKGTPAEVIFPEINKNIFTKVNYTGNFIHPNNRTYKIRVNIPNKEKLFKPNLMGIIKIKVLEVKDAVVIPLSLLQEDIEGNNFVFVLEPTDEEDIFSVKKKFVKPGDIYKNRVWIKEGLQPGEIIPLTGARGLTEGDLVKITRQE